MSLALLIVGVLAQCVFAGVQAMLVIFSGAGIANHAPEPTPAYFDPLLLGALIVLPAVSLLTAAGLVYLYLTKSPLYSHGWHAAPLLTFSLYLAWALWANQHYR